MSAKETEQSEFHDNYKDRDFFLFTIPICHERSSFDPIRAPCHFKYNPYFFRIGRDYPSSGNALYQVLTPCLD